MSTAINKTASFEYAKSTPGTHVFKEIPAPGQPPIVGSLYIKQWACPPKTGPGTKVTMTLEITDATTK